MSASGGGSLSSDLVGGSAAEVKNMPISLDHLSVSLLIECAHSSKVIVKGFLCRRERVDDGSGDADEDRFILYWAVLRAKQLFLFHSESSTKCKEVIMLSQFLFEPEAAGASQWPKGLKTCTLRAPSSAGGCDSSSAGTSDQQQHQLGWWPRHYRWQPHLQDQTSKARADPSLAQAECRQLLIAANEVRSDFVGPPLPGKAITPKRLFGIFRPRERSDSSGGGVGGGGCGSPAPPAEEPQSPPPVAEDDESEAIYACPDEPGDPEEVYEVPEPPETPPTPAQPPQPLPPARKPPKPLHKLPPKPLHKLPPKPCITKEMLGSRQLRPTLPLRRSDDSDGGSCGSGASEGRQPPQPCKTKEMLGSRQLRPPLHRKPSPTPSPSSLWEQLTSGRAVDASVCYFYHAFDCEPRLQDVTSKLDGAPVGTFLIHGFSRNSHRKVLTLLVQSSAGGVCKLPIKETNEGVKITASAISHASLSQLLYHYHIYNLPDCKGSEAPRLVKPLKLPGPASFLSASAWCLGEKSLCLSLLGGAPDGTFAVVADSETKQLSLYTTVDGESVRMRIHVDHSHQQPKFHVTETDKFDTLEEFLLHYHRHNLSVSAAESGRQATLRLTIPCQLSEKFISNLQKYLTDHIQEEMVEDDANDCMVVITTKRYFSATLRTETPLDDDECQPTLTVCGNTPCEAVVDVEESQIRGFQCVYSVQGQRDVQFDSLDKLLLYANHHPEKLA